MSAQSHARLRAIIHKVTGPALHRMPPLPIALTFVDQKSVSLPT